MQKKLGSYTLLIDAGNSWIKWGLCLEQKSVIFQDKCLPNKFKGELESLVLQYQIERVGVCSVRGAIFTTQIELLCQTLNLPPPRFMQVSDGRHLLKNNYGDPSKLGVDRWMALLAASQLTDKPFIVIDAGTAITVDLVNNEKCFLGGVIIPGIKLAASALSTTANIEWDQDQEDRDWSRIAMKNTQDGINSGVKQMIIGGIRYMIDKSQFEVGENAVVFACGGGWPIIGAHIGYEIRYHPSLVLDGILIGLNQ